MKQKWAKKNLMSALDEKIFFVIKYWLMSAFQGVAIIIVVFFLGAVNVLELIILGAILFIISLVLSRRFNENISSLAMKITLKLNKYPKIKKMIAKNI